MYATVRSVEPPTLGALPSWITNILGAVVRGRQLVVPTPIGNQTVNLDNPAQMAALFNLLKGTKIVSAPSSTPTTAPAPSFIDQIPGGWFTVAAVGLGVVLWARRR